MFTLPCHKLLILNAASVPLPHFSLPFSNALAQVLICFPASPCDLPNLYNSCHFPTARVAEKVHKEGACPALPAVSHSPRPPCETGIQRFSKNAPCQKPPVNLHSIHSKIKLSNTFKSQVSLPILALTISVPSSRPHLS